MNLVLAQHYAEKLKLWLAPYAKRIEIAGSVRRRRPVCNDIDLLCIPKYNPGTTDLLGNVDRPPRSQVWEFLTEYVKHAGGKASWRSLRTANTGSTAPDPDTVNFMLTLPKCELDVFIADEATFITRLITRTGSKEHNIWIAQRAQQLNGKFHPQTGLVIDGVAIRPKTEEEFYAALKLPYIDPPDRETELLRRFSK